MSDLERDDRWPDFFIVGAPKCGTTSMDSYLGQHPEIVVAEPKEPHFFGSDLRFKPPRISREHYMSRFTRVGPARRVGEASVWYLYSKEAAREIAAVCPEARIVIMLRNPVDLLPSLHSEFLFNRNEDIDDFSSALSAEADRKQGRRIPPSAHFVQGLFYREVVKLSEQVARYLETFGRRRVHVIFLGDLIRDPQRVYAGTLRFLGVEPGFQAQFQVHRRHRRRRRLPGPLARAERLLPSGLRGGLLRSLFVSRKPREPMDAALRRRLQKELAPEIERLSVLLGRDLRYWVGSEETGT